MKISILGKCRGDGKAYVKIQVVEAAADSTLRSSACTQAGRSVPCSLYRLDTFQATANGYYVATIALFDVKEQRVTIDEVSADGQSISSAEFAVNMAGLKWQSRANYLFNKQLASQIRDIDKGFYRTNPVGTLIRMIDAGSEVIARVRLRMPFFAQADVSLEVLGSNAQPLDGACIVVLGEGTIPPNQSGETVLREMMVSVMVPTPNDEFCLCVVDRSGLMESGFFYLEQKAFHYVLSLYRSDTLSAADDPEYDQWFRRQRASVADLECQRAILLPQAPRFSVVVHGRSALRERTDRSIGNQSYQNYEVVVAGTPDCPNVAAAACCAQGDFVVFVEAGDMLAPNALFEYSKAITNNWQADMVYCDEDCVDPSLVHSRVFFKPDWSPDFLRSCNYVSHLLAIRASLAREVCMQKGALADDHLYDLALRVAERTDSVLHVPAVLYHADVQKPQVGCLSSADEHERGRCALEAHIRRLNIEGTVNDGGAWGCYHVACVLPGNPLVSIVIPNKDHIGLLRGCIESIMGKVTYENYEIVIVENNSTEAATFDAYELLQREHRNVRVVTFKGNERFNFSRLVNHGVSQSRGEFVLLLNNDTEVIAPDFIEQMLGFFVYPNTGVVGAKLLYRDRTVQHAGVSVALYEYGGHMLEAIPDADGGYFGRANLDQDLSCVTGACQMIRKETYEAVGGYAEEYAIAYNDVDFCLKVIAAGKRVVYTPYAKLYHFEFSSRGRDQTAQMCIRDAREGGLLRYRWPWYHISGDPYIGANIDSESPYYGLAHDAGAE